MKKMKKTLVAAETAKLARELATAPLGELSAAEMDLVVGGEFSSPTL